MNTQEYDFNVVWDGRPGVYLTALTGCEPYVTRPAALEPSHTDHWHTTTAQLIVAALTKQGPMTLTQLASGCNRACGETRHALTELAAGGTVELEQPCLLAIEPHAGQLWRLK